MPPKVFSNYIETPVFLILHKPPFCFKNFPLSALFTLHMHLLKIVCKGRPLYW